MAFEIEPFVFVDECTSDNIYVHLTTDGGECNELLSCAGNSVVRELRAYLLGRDITVSGDVDDHKLPDNLPLVIRELKKWTSLENNS